MKNLAIAALIFLAGCSHPQPMELWYWHHSYLVSPQAVSDSKRLIDRAAGAGYTGLALWDSGLLFLSTPDWAARNAGYLREVIQYAEKRGMRVLPVVAPYGHSNDMLIANPNWAEGQRIVGAAFRVTPDGRRLRQMKKPVKTIGGKLKVTPWHQYHLRFSYRTQRAEQIKITDGAANRLDASLPPSANQDWTRADYTFNSASSTEVRISPSGGFPMRDLFAEETALVYVLRRAGTPLRIYDASRTYREGADFDPIADAKFAANPRFDHDNYHDPGPVTIPPGSRLRPGRIVNMDYYAVAPVYDEAVGVCLTDAGAERWVLENARTAIGFVSRNSGLFLSHDEMRHMNSCAGCRAMNMTAGELLAWSFRRTVNSLQGFGQLYVWSDMFDPFHNARDHFYFVEGNIAGSWRGVPPSVNIVNWNLERLTPSLTWFSGDDPRQPVPHRQIIAGFYDSADRDGAAAARREMARATGIPGIAGMMYTTWTNDYSQLEPYAAAARTAWNEYRNSLPLQLKSHAFRAYRRRSSAKYVPSSGTVNSMASGSTSASVTPAGASR